MVFPESAPKVPEFKKTIAYNTMLELEQNVGAVDTDSLESWVENAPTDQDTIRREMARTIIRQRIKTVSIDEIPLLRQLLTLDRSLR